MQKFLLYTFGTVSLLLVAAGVGLTVLNSYQQVQVQGRTLGAQTALSNVPSPIPTEIIPTQEPLQLATVLAQDQGLQNTILIRKTVTVFKEKDLQTLWTTIYGPSAPPIPVVDFRKSAVMAVIAGTQPSGGYTITFSGISEDESSTVVQFNETLPGEACKTAAVMTSPFVIVQIPNTGKVFKTAFNTQQGVCN